MVEETEREKVDGWGGGGVERVLLLGFRFCFVVFVSFLGL